MTDPYVALGFEGGRDEFEQRKRHLVEVLDRTSRGHPIPSYNPHVRNTGPIVLVMEEADA